MLPRFRGSLCPFALRASVPPWPTPFARAGAATFIPEDAAYRREAPAPMVDDNTRGTPAWWQRLPPHVRGLLSALPFLLFFLGMIVYGELQGEQLGFTVILLPGVALFLYLMYRLQADAALEEDDTREG